MSATAGRSWDLDRGHPFTTIALAAYRNSSPRWATGTEFGIIKFPMRTESDVEWLIPSQDSISGPTLTRSLSRSEESLSYGTLFLARSRGTQGGVRAQFMFGPAVYARHEAYFSEYRDSSGVVTSTNSGRQVQRSFGLMGGVGATFGRGPIRPSVRARGHWILSQHENNFVTVEAGADFH